VLKPLLTAIKVVIVQEESQAQYMSGLSSMEFHIPHASKPQLTTMTMTPALPLTNAKTAPGHHAQLDKIAKTNAGVFHTRSISSLPISEFPEKTK
jgi:hypothetical protein